MEITPSLLVLSTEAVLSDTTQPDPGDPRIHHFHFMQSSRAGETIISDEYGPTSKRRRLHQTEPFPRLAAVNPRRAIELCNSPTPFTVFYLEFGVDKDGNHTNSKSGLSPDARSFAMRLLSNIVS
jgi:hypothetical protein